MISYYIIVATSSYTHTVSMVLPGSPSQSFPHSLVLLEVGNRQRTMSPSASITNEENSEYICNTERAKNICTKSLHKVLTAKSLSRVKYKLCLLSSVNIPNEWILRANSRLKYMYLSVILSMSCNSISIYHYIIYVNQYKVINLQL